MSVNCGFVLKRAVSMETRLVVLDFGPVHQWQHYMYLYTHVVMHLLGRLTRSIIQCTCRGRSNVQLGLTSTFNFSFQEIVCTFHVLHILEHVATTDFGVLPT